jgi:SAM-dependent methyltransferase
MTLEEERKFYEEEYGVILSNEKGVTPEQLYEKQMPDSRMYLSWCQDRLRKSDRCLEIGCASGYFLKTLRPKVTSVAGIETHRTLRAFCEKQEIDMRESLEACRPGEFDKVFLFFVLEHIGEPLGFLRAIQRVLSPGGEIHVVIPNVNDALYSRYDIPAFRAFYFTPAHQNYYSPQTLDLLADKAGLRCETRGYQRYDLSNHMNWMMSGRPGGQGKFNGFLSETVRDGYAASLVERGLFDTIYSVMTARNVEAAQ